MFQIQNQNTINIHVYTYVYQTSYSGVLDLADSYCEAELKKKCERLICQRVTIDNVVTLFAVAHKYKTQVN